MSTTAAEIVEKLKQEGNAFFIQKSYIHAAEKYTEALKIDKDNAILYSNRSACRLNLKAYLDASADARKATEIDPGFSKAYARLATAQDALREPHRSIEAWQKALNTLPKENLTSAQLSQKSEYTKGLASAKQSLKNLEASIGQDALRINSYEVDPPWICAQKMIPQLVEANDYKSSAWALMLAYNDFSEGVRRTFEARTEGSRRQQSVSALAYISNGILADPRIFHISDNAFIRKYNEQVIGEAQIHRAWTQGGPDLIKQEVLKRLDEEGWHTTAPALKVTVRAWIIQGFVQGGLYRNHIGHLEYMSRAIDIIKWGRELFKDVQKDVRGAIFEATFLRGLQTLHLAAFLEVISNDEMLEAINQEADEVIAGVDAATIPPRKCDPGFISAFYYHPKGHALSMKAIYHRERAHRMKAQPNLFSSNLESISKNLRLASQYYVKAADCFGEDDENHALFLKAALEMMWSCKTSARNQLVVMERLRLAIPKMRQIWANSSLAKQQGDSFFKTALDMEKELRDGLEKGKFRLDDPVTIQIEN
ncbi:hypothetical protein GG344DRAFT_46856 [Lentinula edodes]|nr:hypothetical protein GG344DRAFT_46856 [Lentinula edodes]